MIGMKTNKKPGVKEINTAIAVLKWYIDSKGDEVGEKINKAPVGKFWDNWVNIISLRYDEKVELVESVIGDLEQLV